MDFMKDRLRLPWKTGEGQEEARLKLKCKLQPAFAKPVLQTVLFRYLFHQNFVACFIKISASHRY